MGLTGIDQPEKNAWSIDVNLVRLLALTIAAAMFTTVLGVPARADAQTANLGFPQLAESAREVGPAEAGKLAETAGLPSVTRAGHDVNLGKAEAWELADGSWYVSAPASGENVYMATVSATLTPKMQVSQTGEALLVGDDTGGTATFWVDGEKILDQYFDNGEHGISPMFSWGEFNDCLSSAGIAAWVVAAISAACGIACGATAGVGCLVCMSGLGLVGGSTLGYCLEEAQ